MSEKELRMRVEMTIIDNLGVKMYSSLPSVVAELVANSWDADASEVKIIIPEGSIDENTIIEIIDDGYGMDFDEVNDAFLRVGRHRRKELGTDKTKNGRDVIGRKGIGNLAAFGVSNEVIVETLKNSMETVFTLNLDDIRATPKGKDYFPPFQKKGTKSMKTGTAVKLTKLKRTRAINIDYIRDALIRIFSIIDNTFKVYLNGKIITPEERKSLIESEYLWEINEEIKEKSGWIVNGIIGTSEKPLDENLLGIIVMARGKMIQKSTFFDVKGGKEHARSYMWGELNAEFFDAEEDLMGTARNTILEESDEGQAFLEWVRKKIIEISNDWSNKRRIEREKVIRKHPAFEDWLLRLSKHEKKIADKMIKAITSNPSLTNERVIELADFVKDSFNYASFRDLAYKISESPTIDDVKLIELFEEWEFLRAKEMLRIFEGNLATIEKLGEFIKSDAKEVPTIHKFFKDFPWLIDPKWTDFQNELSYAKLLREKFPENKELPEKNKRIDFLALGFNDTIHVIELKRPSYNIAYKDLEQIQRYVNFVRSRCLGSDPKTSYQSVSGLIICGGAQKSNEVQVFMDSLATDRIYVRLYRELISIAQKLYKKHIDIYEDLKTKKEEKNIAARLAEKQENVVEEPSLESD